MFSIENFTILIIFIYFNASEENTLEYNLEHWKSSENYTYAMEICLKVGLKLINIENIPSKNLVHKYAVDKNLSSYWIDKTDYSKEVGWLYSYDLPTKIINFNKYCIIGKSKSLKYNYEELCENIHSVICYRQPENIDESQLRVYPRFYDWQTAKKMCLKSGLRLIKIQSDVVNKMIFHYAKKLELKGYWIDGNDIDEEGKWVYTDGDPITYSKWKGNNPDNFYNEDCIEGGHYEDDYWNDVACKESRYVICYTTTQSIVSFDDSQLHVLKELETADDALIMCKKQDMNLIKIQSPGISKMVFYFAEMNGVKKYWIDGNHKKKEGVWFYSNGDFMIEIKWNTYRNYDSDHKCALGGYFYPYDELTMGDCNEKLSVICYQDKRPIAFFDENSLSLWPEEVSWMNAVKVCQSLGMNLVKIQNNAINNMVYNYAKKKGIGKYWIDGDDMAKEGEWVYLNGDSMTFSKWKGSNPDNWNNEDCAQVGQYEDNFWNDRNCEDRLHVICYGPPIEYVKFDKSQLFSWPYPANYQNATKICKDKGLNLVKIQNSEINEMVFDYARSKGIRQYWIDGNDVVKKGHWVYDNEDTMIYSKWKGNNSANLNNGDCIQGGDYDEDYWNNRNCNDNIHVICYGITMEIVKFERSEMVAWPHSANWSTAIKICKKQGMNLVKIQTEEINTMVFGFSKLKNIGEYWIDGNDIGVEGEWVYNNGDIMMFNKWKLNKPDNVNNANCLQGGYYKDEFWKDENCEKNLGVICYKRLTEAVNFERSQLRIMKTKATFFDAIDMCEDEGMKMIQIHNDYFNNMIFDYATDSSNLRYWIDGHDIENEGVWVHNNGEPLLYSNWASGQPDNWNNEDCIEAGWVVKNNKWNDVSCDKISNVICYKRHTDLVYFVEAQLIILPNPANWSQAIKNCNEKKMNLVKIQNDDINKMVFNFSRKNGIKEYWIDGNDILLEGDWVYDNKDPFIYNKWQVKQPTNSIKENCLQGGFYDNDSWNSENCQKSIQVICYRKQTEMVSFEEIQVTVFDLLTNYKMCNKLCIFNGMNMIKIQNKKTDMMVFKYLKKEQFRQYWMDGNDEETNGEWKHYNGDTMIYFNWEENKPDYSKNYHCLIGNIKPDYGRVWSHDNCKSMYYLICYETIFEFVNFQKNQLRHSPIKVNFTIGVKMCIDQGMNMVKIQNDATKKLVYDYAKTNKLGLYWVDGNDMMNEGRVVHHNGNIVIYKKWKGYNGINVNCLQGGYYDDGFFNFGICYHILSVICYKT